MVTIVTVDPLHDFSSAYPPVVILDATINSLNCPMVHSYPYSAHGSILPKYQNTKISWYRLRIVFARPKYILMDFKYSQNKIM